MIVVLGTEDKIRKSGNSDKSSIYDLHISYIFKVRNWGGGKNWEIVRNALEGWKKKNKGHYKTNCLENCSVKLNLLWNRKSERELYLFTLSLCTRSE